MKITLKGIIQYHAGGHNHVQVLVQKDDDVPDVLHEVGVDVKVNRGMILTFLTEMYNVKPGDIIWPRNIRLEGSDVL